MSRVRMLAAAKTGREAVAGPRNHLPCLPLQENGSVVGRRTRRALFTFLLQV
jgi:hypothetical protein